MTPRAFALAVAVASLAACATAPPPGAVLEHVASNCAAAPSVANAASLVPERERQAHAVRTPVTPQTPCIVGADGRTAPYAVYAVPADFEDKTLTVGASLEASRIFAPQVSTLDAQGAVVRTFTRADYLYRGAVYGVQFRPRAGEAYVLVAADPALVGERYDSIMIGTSTTTTATTVGAISWTSGVDGELSRTFSYEGTIQVSVYDSDTEEGR
jgi:hypothetical protein